MGAQHNSDSDSDNADGIDVNGLHTTHTAYDTTLCGVVNYTIGGYVFFMFGELGKERYEKHN